MSDPDAVSAEHLLFTNPTARPDSPDSSSDIGDDLCYEGYLLVKAKYSSRFRRRYFVLNASCQEIQYYRSKKDVLHPATAERKIISLIDCTVVAGESSEGQPYCIHVRHPKRTFELVCPSPASHRVWMTCLQAVTSYGAAGSGLLAVTSTDLSPTLRKRAMSTTHSTTGGACPSDPAEMLQWKLASDGKVMLDGLSSQKSFWAYKLSAKKHGHRSLSANRLLQFWQRRYFVFAYPFLYYFKGNAPASTTSGCVFLRTAQVGTSTQRGMPCVEILQRVARRASDAGDVGYTIAFEDEATREDWLRLATAAAHVRHRPCPWGTGDNCRYHNDPVHQMFYDHRPEGAVPTPRLAQADVLVQREGKLLVDIVGVDGLVCENPEQYQKGDWLIYAKVKTDTDEAATTPRTVKAVSPSVFRRQAVTWDERLTVSVGTVSRGYELTSTAASPIHISVCDQTRGLSLGTAVVTIDDIFKGVAKDALLSLGNVAPRGPSIQLKVKFTAVDFGLPSDSDAAAEDSGSRSSASSLTSLSDSSVEKGNGARRASSPAPVVPRFNLPERVPLDEADDGLDHSSSTLLSSSSFPRFELPAREVVSTEPSSALPERIGLPSGLPERIEIDDDDPELGSMDSFLLFRTAGAARVEAAPVEVKIESATRELVEPSDPLEFCRLLSAKVTALESRVQQLEKENKKLSECLAER